MQKNEDGGRHSRAVIFSKPDHLTMYIVVMRSETQTPFPPPPTHLLPSLLAIRILCSALLGVEVFVPVEWSCQLRDSPKVSHPNIGTAIFCLFPRPFFRPTSLIL